VPVHFISGDGGLLRQLAIEDGAGGLVPEPVEGPLELAEFRFLVRDYPGSSVSDR
jgi:hypothetical protein